MPLLIAGGSESDHARLQRFAAQIGFLCKLSEQTRLASEADAPASAPAVLGELTLLIPLQGLVDLDAERVRLDKEIKRIGAEIAKCEGKLGNANFVANAPEEVVLQERQRIADFQTQLRGLSAQRERLA